ncbi:MULTISPECIES: HDOD domain-containing protein [Shewanella]|jgi:HD-like signal output (HDOD) protein|uniref:HDOD domain-containing protein n=1 Tax=Shewanella septentrionalis TaxID=2952223 RepID=A0A9X2WXD8_9GAMM|nr:MULTISPECIES: HDOD domain-containing protein [Shewanella]MCB2380618.1 HDOD domain-containing protein [Shewanella sp. SR1]MCS6094563.1 HDOD domain-containing protein [Shewanella baltica]MCS6101856.1 HDOD domain-containing protein [Shewanella baltica]MCS6118262.1 HDOD domain-containing protein [Shewanella baltica]MCS6122828.1 HDOD domain-containing protein [Shewanella baltica]
MTDLEQQVFTQVRAIIANEEQVIGRRGILIPLKKAILAEGDIRNVIDIISSDPALAAHMLMRSNSAQAAVVENHKTRSLKEALIRLGQVNIYRYAFTFYLKERLDELPQPYKKLVQGYWKLTEDIATDAVDSLAEMEGVEVDADEVQTLALFSVFGQIIALTAFAYLNANAEQSFPLSVIKSLIDNQQQTLTIESFEALDLDQDLRQEFMIAHNLRQTRNSNSPGLILRRVLSMRGLLMNPL